MAEIDHRALRIKEIKDIVDSQHPRKVVVGGPGTGKSRLFSEISRKKLAEGKSRFLAITFVGKLGDALADELCGLATTNTLHGFARKFVLEHCPGWTYYPQIYQIIAEDLRSEGVAQFEIGDDHYVAKTKYYKAVGDDDVVHYAIQICNKDRKKTPTFDLLMIDEYQDFNSREAEFVDLLAKKNEVILVGDDDQALYRFKGSSPSFIRSKHSAANVDYESHTLRYCLRCTDVIITYFHALVAAYKLDDAEKGRIKKDFVCYAPDKEEDSKANPAIHLISNCPVGMIAYKIKDELDELVKNQRIKDILVIGDGRSCGPVLKAVAQQLSNYGFHNVHYRDAATALQLRHDIVDAYKLLAADQDSVLGWRILGNPAEGKEKHLKNAKTLVSIIDGTRSTMAKIKDTDLSDLEEAVEEWEIELTDRQDQNKKLRRELFAQELKQANTFLPRPLGNLDITVCSILSAKGLGADVVFLVGFDEGRLPSTTPAADDEVFQMLVAITRAKKRVYLLNTVGKKVSEFINCLDTQHLDSETMDVRR